MENRFECAICQDDEHPYWVHLPCNHRLHTNCYTTLRSHNTITDYFGERTARETFVCPECRTPLYDFYNYPLPIKYLCGGCKSGDLMDELGDILEHVQNCPTRQRARDVARQQERDLETINALQPVAAPAVPVNEINPMEAIDESEIEPPNAPITIQVSNSDHDSDVVIIENPPAVVQEQAVAQNNDDDWDAPVTNNVANGNVASNAATENVATNNENAPIAPNVVDTRYGNRNRAPPIYRTPLAKARGLSDVQLRIRAIETGIIENYCAENARIRIRIVNSWLDENDRIELARLKTWFNIEFAPELGDHEVDPQIRRRDKMFNTLNRVRASAGIAPIYDAYLLFREYKRRFY